MAQSAFLPVNGTVQSLTAAGQDCCSQMLTLRTSNGIVRFTVSSDTYVVDTIRLRPGQRVTVFYDANLPVPLIFPPQYHAALVAVINSGEQVAFGHFGRNLTAADNSLRLNLSPSTEVVTTNGQRFFCSPGNRLLAVFYRTTTRSIPPQTTPDRVIVFC